MRIIIALVVLILVGGFLAANLLIDNRTLTPIQLQRVTTVCSACHGRVPQYQLAATVHNRHAAFNCSVCHGDVRGIKSADTFRIRLGWLGAGVAAVALIGATASLLMINAKGRVK